MLSHPRWELSVLTESLRGAESSKQSSKVKDYIGIQASSSSDTNSSSSNQ